MLYNQTISPTQLLSLAPMTILKQRVDERRGCLARDDQQRHEQKDQDNRNDPPRFVVPGKAKKIFQQTPQMPKESHDLLLQGLKSRFTI